MQEAVTLKREKQRSDLVATVVYHVGVLAIGIVMLYPIVWLFASSLKAPDEIWTTVRSLIPQELHLENYANGWKGYLEDRRPNSAADPYKVAARIIKTVKSVKA